MPGIELLDYTATRRIGANHRNSIIEIVHDVIERHNQKRPGHSNFRYTRAGDLDTSGYDYILVVDGETTKLTKQFKDEIRKAIKKQVSDLLEIAPESVAVRYRLMNASFG